MSVTVFPTTTYTVWTEVKPVHGPGPWCRYDQANEDADEGAGSHYGEMVLEDCHDTPAALARIWLHEALPDIIREQDARRHTASHPYDDDVPELLVRVRVWPDEDTSGEPVALLQATGEEVEKVRLSNACQEITRAEAAVREAWDRLHRQILDSSDAGLAPDRIVRAVDSRVDADAADRILTGHALARRVRDRLTALGEQRATAWADRATGTVRTRLCSTPAHEHYSETLIRGWDCMEVEEPGKLEEAAAIHTADLTDAQALLDTLAAHYDVLTPAGAPATAEFLTPGPFQFNSAVVQPKSST
ncbi:hypothetical protein [Streptomyces sp. NPDC014894]|uniref:hypothetical protein n=1 Tax=Streptomyces sp. NPDC014894 TaxID=3364931 RepID=UPI0036FCA57D